MRLTLDSKQERKRKHHYVYSRRPWFQIARSKRLSGYLDRELILVSDLVDLDMEVRYPS